MITIVQTIIWDLDGTLLDTLADLTDGVNAGLKAYNMPLRTLDEVRHFVGNGVGKLIDRATPADTPQAVRDQVFQLFRAYYQTHCCNKTQPYPGIPALLKQLTASGIRMAVVSNKLDQAVKEMIQFYFGDLFPIAIGDRPGYPRKPAPDSVWEAMALLDAKPENTIYVGDSEVDIATARNAGIACLSVTWGFRPEHILLEQGATYLARTPAEAGRFFGLAEEIFPHIPS